ncbi:MAG: hypothetical protein A3C07_03975 [Candidatus Sungbacteria bacterium RIFCSPHIGHO2_02_FULL_47_11]|uniref:Uncharacterized protein n=1 Tax=Candidatus Sungbacteria bacterium RIFCSPHIGHO2_02_FULL_47_11 TaxID=1802270 RepID=A0A1G2KGR4_9BACT|nr:MAG: hypothetical protein A3C07_03975 [Candidatus Sungbacteria bacterium RIFCSPHIGHO2_02_FULL_47_11]
MEEQPKTSSPYEESTLSSPLEPQSEEELKEAKKKAYVTSEFEAALRGLEFAVKSRDEMLFNGYRELLIDRFNKKVAELSAAEDFNAVAETAREVKTLIDRGKDEFQITADTEMVIEQMLEEIDGIAPKDLIWLLSKSLGREISAARDDRTIIKNLASQYVKATSGKMSVEDALHKAYDERMAAKQVLGANARDKIFVIDKNLIVHRANSVGEATKKIIQPERK